MTQSVSYAAPDLIVTMLRHGQENRNVCEYMDDQTYIMKHPMIQTHEVEHLMLPAKVSVAIFTDK